ncbi:NAD(P)-binding Rossmann-fold superfamily protein [Forsythia ovata]|uniref:Dihydroflavonol 4-reductase n=1 Tax=Forsythia ovata TaxID=205694 RepID=A0ABD1S662_9LAMI
MEGSGGGGGGGGPTTYCVTGATGYIGSWLVKSLLQKGYRVHATARNLEKAFQLLNQWESKDQLRLFTADLQEDGSFDEAVRGCDGVFHVAASMEFGAPAPAAENCYVQTNIIDPAIRGTKNVLKSCSKTSSVRRVVFTSSISTMTSKDNFGRWIPIVDESCQIPVQRVLETKPSGWVYVLSKLLTEEAAFQFANENSIHLISVITTTVAGPFLTPAVPLSIGVLLSPVTGDPNRLSILAAVNSRMGSIALVHIEDICNAHIFLMEHAKAEGRYICCTRSCLMSELVEHLSKECPCPIIQRLDREEHDSVPSEISSKKIKDLGFAYKYGIQDIIHETIGSQFGGDSILVFQNIKTKVQRHISRSLSIPDLNKDKGIRKLDSFFRVIPSTPRVKDGNSEVSMVTTPGESENNEDGQDIPEEEAICQICFVELCEGGETLKIECSCKGELALANRECAIKWFGMWVVQ